MRHSASQGTTVSVLIADASVMVCELLAKVLSRESHMHVVGWEVDSAAAIATATRTNADVALISSNLQDGSGKGLSLALELRAKLPDLRSVILLDRADPQGVVDAFHAGARGIWSRRAGLADLAKCLGRVSEGQVWATSQEMSYLLDNLIHTPPVRSLSENCCKLLTQREQDVVHLVANGLSNREIASQLNLSQHTVKNYLFRVFDKIGVNSRVELVLCALTSTIVNSKAAQEIERSHPLSVTCDDV